MASDGFTFGEGWEGGEEEVFVCLKGRKWCFGGLWERVLRLCLVLVRYVPYLHQS